MQLNVHERREAFSIYLNFMYKMQQPKSDLAFYTYM